MMDDISVETGAIGALVKRIDRLIPKVRACAKASPKINKLRLPLAQSVVANAAQKGVPPGSKVSGWKVSDREGKVIGGLTSDGSFVAGEPPISLPFTRPETEIRKD